MANMRQAVQLSTTELSTEECKLLSLAYKHALDERRSSWSIVNSLEQRTRQHETLGWTSSSQQLSLIGDFRTMIGKEISSICQDMIDLLDKHVLPLAVVPENRIYCLKMKGDYLGHMGEVCTAGECDAIAKKTLEIYHIATRIAEKNLVPVSTARLGLAFNFAVHCYEVQNDPMAAYCLAQKAYEEAFEWIGLIHEGTYEGSAMIMQLLEKKLLLWQNSSPKACNPRQ